MKKEQQLSGDRTGFLHLTIGVGGTRLPGPSKASYTSRVEDLCE
jgi:hypothetical protein